MLDGSRISDDAAGGRLPVLKSRAQFAHLQRQRAFFQRPPHDLDEVIGRERLLDEVVRSVLHRLDRQRNIAMASHQDHRQVAILP
ncbi:hypothetical protein D9M72_329620 [compost metagenome]